MAFFGAFLKGAKGLHDVSRADEAIAALAASIEQLPAVAPGLLAGLSPRRRAESELKLVLLEADWRRRRGELNGEMERRMGELVMQVRELQLKETAATKWDVHVTTQLVNQLAEDVKAALAEQDQKVAQMQAEAQNLGNDIKLAIGMSLIVGVATALAFTAMWLVPRFFGT